MMELTPEQKREQVEALRPIDDVFFEVLARSKAVCQEMLQTILEDPKLIVVDSIVQRSERNLYGRSVRLDALCILGDDKKVNIEVQRSDVDDHLRRARFNASAITLRDSNPGEHFEDIPDLVIVFITEKDFLKSGRTICHIEKRIKETNKLVEDGVEEIFVNAEVHSKTKISELMQCFMQTHVDHPDFPVLSAEVKNLKDTEGGRVAVCATVQKYVELAKNEGKNEGIKEGRDKGAMDTAKLMLERGYAVREISLLVCLPVEKIEALAVALKLA